METDKETARGLGKGAKPTRRVVLVAGGTAGHVYPALAIADAYRRAVAPLEVLFFGTADGFETRLVPRSGFPFFVVRCSPMAGENLLGKARTVGNLGGAVGRARKLLRTARAELVIGLGGYASVPVLLAARSLGLRTAIHESNATPGLANKLLERIVDRVYLGFDEAAPHFQSQLALATGNPIRPDVALLGEHERRPPERERPVRILITGGFSGLGLSQSPGAGFAAPSDGPWNHPRNAPSSGRGRGGLGPRRLRTRRSARVGHILRR